MAELDRAIEVLERADSLALACHVQPDGDALGSLLAMHLLCKANGMPSVASWGEPFGVAPHYEYLPGLDLVTKPGDFPEAPEVMMTFDCGSLGRLGGLSANAERAGELIVLDHHPDNKRFGTINVIVPAAAATAVVVRRVAERLDWRLSRDIALCLYTGLVTDTGRFQYENTTPEVFALAEELARFDLPIPAITRELYEKHRFAYLQLLGEIVGRAELDRERRFVGTWLTVDDLERRGVSVDETEGLIDIVRRTAEADVTCVAKEMPEGTKVSLRSISDDETRSYDVGSLAKHFGGGGHRFAAAFITDASPRDAVAMVRDAIPVSPL